MPRNYNCTACSKKHPAPANKNCPHYKEPAAKGPVTRSKKGKKGGKVTNTVAPPKEVPEASAEDWAEAKTRLLKLEALNSQLCNQVQRLAKRLEKEPEQEPTPTPEPEVVTEPEEETSPKKVGRF